jgi:hypothetical protein
LLSGQLYKRTAYNTDNMGKLFVTVFAKASYSLDIFDTVIKRDRAATHLNNLCTGTNNWLGSNLYRETQLTRLTSNNGAKTRAIPSLYRDYLPSKFHDLPGTASGNTTSLYCRAVMLKLVISRRLRKQ